MTFHQQFLSPIPFFAASSSGRFTFRCDDHAFRFLRRVVHVRQCESLDAERVPQCMPLTFSFLHFCNNKSNIPPLVFYVQPCSMIPK